MIHQGEIYWLDLGDSSSSAPGLRHPHVVIQNNLVNRSRIGTVLVCALTSNLKRAEAPGNVLLDEGEANLPKRSVVNVSQLSTVDRGELTERIGTLAPERVWEIFAGLQVILEPRDVE